MKGPRLAAQASKEDAPEVGRARTAATRTAVSITPVNTLSTNPELIRDGFVAVVKRDCPTCVMVEPVLGEISGSRSLVTLSQDDPLFPGSVDGVLDDTDLDNSYLLGIETVPTLIKFVDGVEEGRIAGWSRPEWESFTGLWVLGADLPEFRPGCGSMSVDPTRVGELRVRHEGDRLASRRVEIAELEDPIEALYDRGWSDGLPLVPPTPERVLAMLDGTERNPSDVVVQAPPDLVDCTVEKIAINAVMAGCRPEYMPVVLAALEAACTSDFNMHGLLATTYFAGPVVVVNGPARRELDMNSGINALGQGNRANATIGRALQLTIRNVGGGLPGGIDRAAMGNPGKLTFCFAEDEEGSPWEPLSVERGIDPDTSAVTLFAGTGVQGIVDQISREPESLARSFAACLRSVGHPKLAIAFDAVLVISPEHARVFAEAGWSKARLREELDSLLSISGAELARGADGIAEGMPPEFAGADLPKFRPAGLLIVHAGGGAGMFSGIIGGWVSGQTGSEPVTREVGQ